jgi:small subunit ribosomal protein S6
MVRDYELMYIVRPDVDDDGLRAAVDSVRSLIEGQGGEVHKTTMWGKRRLAYEVKHLRDGHYVIAELRLDGSKVAEVERALRIHDTVFRHLLVIQEAPSAELEGVEESGSVVVHASPDGETVTAPAPTAERDGTEEIPPAQEEEVEDDDVPAAIAGDDEEA